MNKNKKGKGNKVLIGLLLAVGAVVGLFLILINFITDFLWFSELGYARVFLTKLITQITIGVPVFLVSGILMAIYLKALRRGYYKKIESNADNPAIDKKIKGAGWILTGAFAALLTYYVVTQTWWEFLLFTHSTPFNLVDPIFGLDMAFYVFQLELLRQLNTIAIGTIIAVIAVTVAYYMFMISLRKPQVFQEVNNSGDFDDYDDENFDENDSQGQSSAQFGQINIDELIGKLGKILTGQPGGSGQQQQQQQRKGATQTKFDDENLTNILKIASKQLIVLGVIFFIMVGVSFFLRQFDILLSPTGAVFGAGFTDFTVNLWMFRALAVLSLAAAVGFIIGVKKKKLRTILTIPVVMVLVGALGSGSAWMVQSLVVEPDEINRERRFIEYNIHYTRVAYGLDQVRTIEFAMDNNLTRADIDANAETMANVRINDYEPVRRFYMQMQQIRPYYVFTDVFIGRYMINGELTQTFIAAREIDDSINSPIQQTFINRHIKYTHGFGVVLSRVDQITERGLPEMLIRNIPPVSDVPEIPIDTYDTRNISIYFGRMANDFVIINTLEDEFHFPIGAVDGEAGNATHRYTGDAGIRLGVLNRLMFSLRERNMSILVSGALTTESRIIINRNILQRVNTIMPRLMYDADPYMFIAEDGRLFWVVEGYTVSSRFPYSEPFQVHGMTNPNRINYIRNSVKVLIDAYNGTTQYFIVDPTDPMALTLQSIFPTLFQSAENIPEYMKPHLRYPNMMLNIQAHMFRRYHMTNPVMFYQNEDMWDIAREMFGGATPIPMVPNYYIFKLPGEERAEFVNTIAFTPRERPNMSALLIARNDYPNYGELVLLQLPRGRQIPGPAQVGAQIEATAQISQDFTLWDQAGTVVNRGHMFIVPIENTFLYIQPIYVEAEIGGIPEVRRVIVAMGLEDGDGVRIAYQPTLYEALEELFGPSGAQIQEPPTVDPGADPGQDPGEEPPVVTPDPPTGNEALILQQIAQAFENAMEAQRRGDWAAYGRYINIMEALLGLR